MHATPRRKHIRYSVQSENIHAPDFSLFHMSVRQRHVFIIFLSFSISKGSEENSPVPSAFEERSRIPSFLLSENVLKIDPVFHPSIRKRVPQSLPKVRIELGQNIARSKAPDSVKDRETDSVKDRETENTTPDTKMTENTEGSTTDSESPRQMGAVSTQTSWLGSRAFVL